MRKFILGFVIGALLFSGVSVFADNISLVGKKVGSEAELYLDGKRLSNVIIVDSKGFAPIRELADSLGRDVDFQKKGEKAVINLSASPQLTEILRNLEIDQTKAKIEQLESDLRVLNTKGERLKEDRLMFIKYKNPDVTDEEFEALLLKDETYSSQKEARTTRIAEIEKELADLEARKAELEVQ